MTSIDNPIQAAVECVESDERQKSPVLQGFATALESLRGFAPVGKAIKSLLRVQRDENTQYLLDVLLRQLQKVIARADNFPDDHRRFLVEEFPSLVLDATTKAEDLAFETRIARIAQILASAAEAGPSRSADYTEEMMRVAMALSDADVMVLAEVDKVQAKEIAPTGYVPNQLVNDAWRDSPPKVSRLNDGQIQSICAKLQSFGLVTRVDRNPFKLFHTTIPYGLLQKGHDFIEFIRDRASAASP